MVFVQEKKPRNLPEFPQSVNYQIPEHEILLSFNGDMDAAAWFEWWHDEGYKHYSTYREQNG